jgi:hypothetical protein
VSQSAGAEPLAQAMGLTLPEQDIESALAAIPGGDGEGVFEGLRYGVTVRKSRDGKAHLSPFATRGDVMPKGTCPTRGVSRWNRGRERTAADSEKRLSNV